jgi:hypothetical protein
MEETLTSNVANRAWLLERLRAEIVGPDPIGKEEVIADADHIQEVPSFKDTQVPRKTVDGEEVLWQDPPLKRYGAGILFPTESLRPSHDLELDTSDDDPVASQDLGEAGYSDKNALHTERLMANSDSAPDQSEDSEAQGCNDFFPSSMGLSFLADFSLQTGGIRVGLVSSARYGDDDDTIRRSSCGEYRKKKIRYTKENGERGERTLYFRCALLDEKGEFPSVSFSSSGLLASRRSKVVEIASGLQLLVVSRPWRTGAKQRLVTVSLVNRRSDFDGDKSEKAIFQSGLRVEGIDCRGPWILPYPEFSEEQAKKWDEETQISRLNYRQYKTFAIGHGCAADWLNDGSTNVSEVWTDVMPVFEMPTTTPDLSLKNADGSTTQLKVSMRDLAGIAQVPDPYADLRLLMTSYGSWIDGLKEKSISDEELSAQQITKTVIEKLEHVKGRIDRGLSLLSGQDDSVKQAFQLANEAMFIAQTRGSLPLRIPKWSGENDRGSNWQFEDDFTPYEPSKVPDGIGFWRPFQIAFLLMSLQGISEKSHDERDEVDLIWFPTGGGKTEAYLGVIAFQLFLLRLRGEDPIGVKVLMRYTLRLLTAQQFERATTLFCAMEYIRKNRPDLGTEPFTVGLWVGSATSPNTRSEARSALKRLEEDGQKPNPFILRRCPWCGSKFGPVTKAWTNSKGKLERRSTVVGYERDHSSNSVIFQCPDVKCDFGKSAGSFLDPHAGGKKLPVSLIDEDLRESPPQLLIATVDKFALMAWQPHLRPFFGRDADTGEQIASPPSLIIQDELHLISGPLGSIVGAYETVLEELCTDHRGRQTIKPKIVASTATISRAEQQVRNLYARNQTTLFPPSGFDANASFFAQESRDDNRKLLPGRLYVGVMAPAHLSLQTTQARVFANLMQWPNTPQLTDKERDPWWTLLCFFNSLRELGSATTLLIGDAREYLRVIVDRHKNPDGSIMPIRSPFIEELTSRIPSGEIPEKLGQLNLSYEPTTAGTESDWAKRPIDVCLASSIIEVGVDVPRLSLMTVIGQPKTTAQYIQVTSRVGRKSVRPGLVFTLYGAGKSRDRSHYERFKSYHQKIYSNVEPTSVTPFSIPAIERTLHALIVSYIRQVSPLRTGAERPTPAPFEIHEYLKKSLKDIINRRVATVSPDQSDYVSGEIEKLFDHWSKHQPAEYGSFFNLGQDAQLMHVAGQTPPDDWEERSWPTLLSMRGVDASAEAEVTSYLFGEGNGEQ